MCKLGKVHLSRTFIISARQLVVSMSMKFRTKILKVLFSVIIFLLFCHWPSREQGPDMGALWSDKEGQRRLKKIVDRALDKFVSDHLSISTTSNSLVSPENLDRIIRVQSYLACLVHNAKWDGEVTVNGTNLSLVLPKHCKFSSPHNISLHSFDDICLPLSGKKILLVGSETTYHLHELWLRMLEHRRNESHDCPGREFCTFHHICRDMTVYPPEDHEQVGRKKKIPSSNFLRATKSAVLQYTFTTTLYAGSNQRNVIYQRPRIDPVTGIRQVSQYWVRRARKANIAFLNLAPLPAPASTYALIPSGDWGFAFAACHQKPYFPSDACKHSLSYGLASVALDMTFHKFMPAVLSAMSMTVGSSNPLTVWQGNWFIQPSCARKGLPREMSLLTDFWSLSDLSDRGMDAWTYLFNLQGAALLLTKAQTAHAFIVYMQDRILPQILPFYGAYYLPLTLPVLDQSFDALSSDPSNEMHPVKDCIRTPWPNFSDDLGHAYFTAVSAVLTLTHV